MLNDHDIARMTEEDLIALNRRIVARLRHLQQARTYRKLSQFQIGDEVRFTGPDGRRISGRVVRVNKKTVSLVTSEGDRWNVAPAFLRKSRCEREEEARQPQNVIAFRGR